ncbi:MAG: electron transfer flavoprotein subunit beta/FixA family protein [Chloroflexi bacterium]|nr:electron transfer flavoprotein subunit beta/FixA family protein [Chloroflexota bacterium]
MNMIVCVKQIPDPEAPPATFKIDSNTNKVVPPQGIEPVISPFDAQAVEAALRLKDVHGGKVTVISMGPASAKDAVKHALAMGGDEGVLLEDEAFGDSDSYVTAYILAQAIKKIGEYDIIFCGRQAADWDAGQVGLGIAEILGIPSVTVAQKVEMMDGKVEVERVVENGYEVVEAGLPVLVTITNELGEPRYPTLKGIMAAARKQLTLWQANDLGMGPDQMGLKGNLTQLRRLFVPAREGTCEVIEGENLAEAAVKLALRLRETKVI